MKQSRNEMRPRADGPPSAQGLYDPSAERDGCGIGFIARLDARPEHRIVEDAVRILVNLEHRGAVGGRRSVPRGTAASTPFHAPYCPDLTSICPGFASQNPRFAPRFYGAAQPWHTAAELVGVWHAVCYGGYRLEAGGGKAVQSSKFKVNRTVARGGVGGQSAGVKATPCHAIGGSCYSVRVTGITPHYMLRSGVP